MLPQFKFSSLEFLLRFHRRYKICATNYSGLPWLGSSNFHKTAWATPKILNMSSLLHTQNSTNLLKLLCNFPIRPRLGYPTNKIHNIERFIISQTSKHVLIQWVLIKTLKTSKINYYIHCTYVEGTLNGSDFKKSEPKSHNYQLKSYEIHLR